jgi:hypothetical protein
MKKESRQKEHYRMKHWTLKLYDKNGVAYLVNPNQVMVSCSAVSSPISKLVKFQKSKIDRLQESNADLLSALRGATAIFTIHDDMGRLEEPGRHALSAMKELIDKKIKVKV